MRTPWTGLRRFLGFTAPRRPIARRRTETRLLLESLEDRMLLSAGTWTELSNFPNMNTGSTGTMLLQPNGKVMISDGDVGSDWWQLSPSASGSYANGTFRQLASMQNTRLYFASDVLANGKIFVAGGEYSSAGNETNLGEMYNTATNSWSAITTISYTSELGDAISDTLPNGNILVGDLNSTNTYIYNPGTNAWSKTGNRLYSDPSAEESWVKLPDNSILSVDLNGNKSEEAQRYVPSSGTWVDAGNVGVQLGYPPGSGYDDEMGPGFLLPNGQVFFLGASGATAYYTESTNTWTTGPSIPDGLGCADAPGAIMPNGDILFAASPLPSNVNWNPPTHIFEYNPTTQVYTDVTPNDTYLSDIGCYPTRMLDLPSGQVLFSDSSEQLWVYTPSGSPNSAWQPTIASITSTGSGTYTLTGTQLNGISEGAAYGDDAQQASNYPIVQLTSGGTVTYATTSNWSSTGVATGSTPESTNFTMPSTGSGAYLVSVVANGIASNPVLLVQMSGSSDSMTLRLDPNNSADLQVLENNTVLGEFALSSFSSILVSGATSGTNSLTVDYSTGGFFTTPITFSGGSGGSNSLTVTDAGDTGTGSWQLNAGSVTGKPDADSSNATVTYSNVQAVTMDGSGGGGTVTVAAANTAATTINASGSATVNVDYSSAAVNVNTVSGSDTVYVGSNGSALGGTLATINGAVNVSGTGGSTALYVDDSGDSTAETAVLTNNQLTGLGNAGAIGYGSGVTSLILAGGSGNNVWDINGTASGSPVTVNAGSGNNSFVIASSGELLSGIQGNVTLNGGTGTNTLTVDDQNNAANGDTYTIAAGSIASSGSASIGYSAVSAVTVNGSSTANITYNLTSTDAATPLMLNGGSGANVFNLTPTSKNLNNLAGAVTIDTGSGSTVNLDDQSYATASTYTITATNVSRSNFAGLTYAGLGKLTLNGGSVADTYDIPGTASGSSVTVTGGLGNDIFNVGDSSNTLDGIQGTLTINGGKGTNTLNVHDQGSSSGQTYTLSKTTLTRSGAANIVVSALAHFNITASNGGNDALTILSPAPTLTTTFTGGSGTNTLTGPNLTNTWTIKSNNGGTLGKVTFSNFQNLIGGTGVDAFKFTSATTSTVQSINGGGAPTRQGDWLDYSAFVSTSTVTVDLATGVATNVSGGVTGIQNVIGGKGTNTLTGDAQGNILIGGSGTNTIVGGSGNSLLIGGSGHGSITAGGNEDILIAGTTTYSLSTAAGKNSLMAILAELQSADTFAEQVYDLIHGTDSGDPNGHGSDLNGANKLTWGGTSPKVKPSLGSFTLNRNAAAIADWFFSNASSTVNGFVNGVDEHNNNAIGVF